MGRSNVGKSSLLNALAGRRIARISGTPGKTRMLNVYEMQLGRRERGEVPSGADRAPDARRHEPPPSPLSLYVLDLPGYGYARASKSDRQEFRGLIAQTVARERLAGVIWLLDVRRDPSEEDREMQDQFAARRTRVLAAVTKSDKVPRGQRVRRERELRESLALDADQAIVTSARTGEGIPELRLAIGALITKATE